LKTDTVNDEPQLRDVLGEFRTALREEIFSAQRSSSSNAVPLTNGRKIGQVGAAFQYAFTVDSVLNVPGDAPGDLIVPGKERLPATIISIEGLTITISLGIDLGSFVPNARLQTDLTFLLRKLIERIELLNTKSNAAGDRILGFADASGVSEPISCDDLNVEQNAAVASSVGRDTTFIWGPPGTGKTKTIGAIGATLFNRSRSVLLVSHTNTAVDGALLQIAKRLGDRANDGTVLRIGVPKDEELKGKSELLIATHVEKRSTELTARILTLEDERTEKTRESLSIQRLIAICEWINEAASDLERASAELAAIQSLDADARMSRTRLEELRKEEPRWRQAANDAAAAQQATRDANALRETLRLLELSSPEITEKIASTKTRLESSKELLGYAEAIEPFRQKRKALPSLAEQSALSRHAREAAAKTQEHSTQLSSRLTEAEALHNQSTAASALSRLWKGLPKPELQEAIVRQLRDESTTADAAAAAYKEQAAQAAGLLKEIEELENQIAPFGDVSDAKPQKAVVDSLETELSSVLAEQRRLDEEVELSRQKLDNSVSQVRTFEVTHGAAPDEVLANFSAYEQQLKEQKNETELRERAAAESRDVLESSLRRWLTALRDFGLAEGVDGTAENMLVALQDGHEKARAEVADHSFTGLCQDRDKANARLRQIAVEIDAINEQLKHVEETIISEARIIATTLTRAYLRDTIQARRFDTVILDEASMAPIPALWVAASLADRNVIAVGDFKQLPPIVQSSHELALKWLGQDVFEIADIRSAYDRSCPPTHFVALKEQHRMHPDIRVIADQLFYRVLRDAKSVEKDDELDGWYRRDWGNDSPVLLVDTGPTGAWVTSVAKGARASRLNFLSATICVDLADQFLTETPPAARPRILIISPYSPHAKLLKLLIKTQNLDGRVEAGTVHSFQGSEAPIVIIDLVNDEPHWRVGMFNPSRDEANKRLLNVAITRARRRLVVVGDFDYCQKLSKNAFLGREFLPFLQQFYKKVNALDIVPAGLSARAAQTQSVTFGGNIEPSAARLVVMQDNFYPIFLGDISRAKKRIVIYSPFITSDRLATLEPQIKAAADRHVRVYVITKPQSERGRREIAQYQGMERALLEWNAFVIHKIGMHEKLVFVDDEIVWSGSLNPLSYSNTQEIMERRRSREVVEDFVSTLRLNELIGAYDAGDDKCPICGREMMPAEGAEDPFYWRCSEEGWYSRSVDDPPLRGGMLTCHNCGSPIEFGEWADKPAWRCVKNRHHHQRVHRNHLRLPRMRALVPKRTLHKLDKQFGILEYGLASVTSSKQSELF
jgi:superfamily I DNA and/or RNA helicase